MLRRSVSRPSDPSPLGCSRGTQMLSTLEVSVKKIIPLLAALILAGCSAQEAPDSSQDQGSLSESKIAAGVAAQEEAISSDGISAIEYESAVNNYITCMDVFGIKVASQGWDPINNKSIGLFMEESENWEEEQLFEIEDQCLTANLTSIRAWYRINVAPQMNADLMEYVQTCITASGVSIFDDEFALFEIIETVGVDNKDRVIDCVVEGMGELYPEIQGFEVVW